MGMEYTPSYFEYNGGILSWAEVDPEAYVEPTSPLDYTQFGGTDGIAIAFDTEQELVQSDQSFPPSDVFVTATSAMITLTCQESTVEKIILGMGYDITDPAIVVAGSTDQSVIEGSSITTKRGYFGAERPNKYYTMQFEKRRSHDTAKIWGWRVFLATPSSNVKLSAKKKEKGWYDLEFTCLGSNSLTHAGHIGYLLQE